MTRYRLMAAPSHTTTTSAGNTVNFVAAVTFVKIPWWKFWAWR